MSANSRGQVVSGRTENRWRRHPVLSWVIRIAVFLLPVAATLVVSIFLSRALPIPQGTLPTVLWWVVFIGGSLLTLVACRYVLRHLLPLAALLNLSLIFPDKAPSRFAVARRQGSVKALEHEFASAHAAGRDDEQTRRAQEILSLVAALNVHDRRTRGHSERVRVFTDMLAEELGVSSQDRDRLHWAAMLHDIGKLSVSAEILNKPTDPDATERIALERHPDEGARLIEPLRSWLGGWAAAVQEHHERWDGSGYPRGLKGEAISLSGRIVSVADAFETMTAYRSYKRAMSVVEARQELVRKSGSHFDPTVVRAFLNISVGKLGRALGLAAWLAEVPLIAPIGPRLSQMGSGGTAGAATIATAGVLVLTGIVSLPLNGRSPVVSSSHVEAARSAPGPVDRGAEPAPQPAPPPVAINPSPATTTNQAGPAVAIRPATVRPSRPQAAAAAAAPGGGRLRLSLAAYAQAAPRVSPHIANGAAIDAAGALLTGSVNYGDGSGSAALAFTGDNFLLQHAYRKAGRYVITVTVRDSLGAVASATLTVSVNEGLHTGQL